MRFQKHALAAAFALFSLAGIAEAQEVETTAAGKKTLFIVVTPEMVVVEGDGNEFDMRCPDGRQTVFNEWLGIDQACNYVEIPNDVVQALLASAEEDEAEPDFEEEGFDEEVGEEESADDLQEAVTDALIQLIQEANPDLQEALVEAFAVAVQSSVVEATVINQETTVTLAFAEFSQGEAESGPVPEAGEDEQQQDEPVTFVTEDTTVLDSTENANNNDAQNDTSP